MFTIPVGDLISSYTGDSQVFSFDGAIFDGYFSDLTFTEPLRFTLKLLSLEDGIHATFSDVFTTVVYEKHKYQIRIGEFDRMWKKHRNPDDPDDIGEIDARHMTIDIAPVIREEIIMECSSQSL